MEGIHMSKRKHRGNDRDDRRGRGRRGHGLVGGLLHALLG